MLILVAPATNVISESSAWLVPNRLRKTCLALQCIRVVVCGTAFFIDLNKTKLITMCQKRGKIIYLYKDVNVNFFVKGHSKVFP